MAADGTSTVALGANAKEQLKSIVGRVETLTADRQQISDDIAEIYAEAKSSGFDTARIREVVKLRSVDRAKREEQEAVRDLYMHALGMLSDLPLGEAATAAALTRAEERKKAKKARSKSPLVIATKAFGKPVEPTEEEKAKGVVVAFEKNGTRTSLALGGAP
jgi:uncharacterized protein (UPF0335 family)